jgi:hypothetical protein
MASRAKICNAAWHDGRDGDARARERSLWRTSVDGIRFPDAFGPILVTLIVAGAVTLAVLRSRRGLGW